MTASGVGEMHLCEGRMNSTRYTAMLQEVLEPSVLKLFEEETPEYMFQQDNAPCHRSRESMRWFQENGVRLLDWPTQSPDLSPIEHLWHVLKRKVSAHNCDSKRALRQNIIEEWNLISADTCLNLVSSMPRRIKAVTKVRGGSTKY